MKAFPLPWGLALAALCIAAVVGPAFGARAGERPRDAVALGRYLVQTSGCNDCHSPGYAQRGGQTAEASWLTGDVVGWRGPWGTTYPGNLRLFMATMTEAQWLRHARTMEPRPPMPWFNIRAMSDTDLRAIYRYVKAAGPAGLPAPAYVPPGQPVSGPVIQFP
ncbi:cytochrome c precursor [Variovorax soli]|uniref:Mono/diheme cytochrome c family protein n=1 Tax=Variovorax soli TaxID=376815 RepID=A0ABU1NA03_9BURK|nr:cytochrome c precursor [Variovorax soli]MDR6535272.1 mono/diheme cytochrome c family protein [Variovorax soli]